MCLVIAWEWHLRRTSGSVELSGEVGPVSGSFGLIGENESAWKCVGLSGVCDLRECGSFMSVRISCA